MTLCRRWVGGRIPGAVAQGWMSADPPLITPRPDNKLSGTFGETFKKVNPRMTQLAIGGNDFEGKWC